MNKILGLQDSYLQRQFEMSGVELDRATNSSYMDMTRWGAGGDHHYQSLIQEKSCCPSGRWSQSWAAVTPISQLSSRSLKRWKECPVLFASKYLFCADFEVLYNTCQRFHRSDCVSEHSADSEHGLHHRDFCRKSQTEIFRKINYIKKKYFTSLRFDTLLQIVSVCIWNWFGTTVTRRTAVQTYFNNRANVDTYMTLLNL